MSDSDSPSGSSTVVNTSEPSALHQEFLRPGMEAALQEGLNSPQSYFPNSTVVPFSNQSEAALGGIEQRALAGNPLNQAAQQQLMQTLGGDYTRTGQQQYAPNKPSYGQQTPQNMGYSMGVPPNQQPQDGPAYAGPSMREWAAKNGGDYTRTSAPPQYQTAMQQRPPADYTPQAQQGGGQTDYGAQYDQHMSAYNDRVAENPAFGALANPGMGTRDQYISRMTNQAQQGGSQSAVRPGPQGSAGGAGLGAFLRGDGVDTRNPNAESMIQYISGGGQQQPSQATPSVPQRQTFGGGQQAPQPAMQSMPTAQTAMGGNQQQPQAPENYQNGNPYMDAVGQRIQNTVRPGIDSQFANSGRYGSGAHQESMTRAFADAAAPYAFQNYENERGRQMQAAGLAPSLAQTDYNDLDRLAGVGAQRENLAGQQVQDQINRFNFGQQEPQSRISSYLGNINAANLGSNSTATTPTFNNRGAGIAGGALVGSQLTGDPLLGGLLGAGAGFFL